MFGLAFFNPFLLWGLAGASIPVLIHLFNRRRFRSVVWAAMEFLISSSKLTARRLKILQALLLLTRIGIVCLLALGVARPYLTGTVFGGALARSKSSAVIILDNSYSMGWTEEGGTVLDAAKAVTKKIVSSFRRGDSLTFLLMASKPQVITQGNPSPERLLRLIEGTELSDESTDIPLSIEKGLEILAAEKNTRKELFVITDCQRNGWRGGNEAAWQKISGTLSKGDVEPRVYVVDVSRPAGEDLAVSSVRLPAYPLGVGKKHIVEVTVKAFVGNPSQRPVIKLFLDDEKSEVARTEGGEFKDGVSTGRLTFSVNDAGLHWGKIAIEADGLEADNTHYFTVRARESVAVLCIDGVGSPDAFESGIAYLANALAPERGMDEIRDISNVLDPKIVTLSQFWEEDLTRYAIVALSNVGTLSARMYEKLQGFVETGGNLMVFLGDKVDALEYSERYASSATSFLPCPIGSAKGELPSTNPGAKAEATYRISEIDYGHAGMQAFEDSAGGDLTTAKFYRFYSLSPPATDPDVKVLAKFTDGSPYMVQKRCGQGKTILFSSSCDLKWSNLPLKPAFLPLIHRIAYYLVSASDEGHNLTVGERIVQRVKAEAALTSGAVINPRGRTFKVIATEDRSAGGEEETRVEPYFTFEDTNRAGIYTLTTSEGTGSEGSEEDVRYYAVNVDKEESDISALEQDAIEKLMRWKNFRYLKAEGNEVGSMERIRYGKEIWRFVLMGLLCFLMVESVLARQIDRG